MPDCSQATFTIRSSSFSIGVPVPEWNNADSSISKNIKVFNMWDEEDIEVVDVGLNEETVTLIGVWDICGEYEELCFPICFPACFNTPLSNAFDNIWTLQNNGEEVEINDLSDCLNGIYVIEQFEIKSIRGTNTAYAYRFRLQKVRDLI